MFFLDLLFNLMGFLVAVYRIISDRLIVAFVVESNK
jgi:hypothetical protein